MKRVSILCVAILCIATLSAQPSLPKSIKIYAHEAGVERAGHIQGIAVDSDRSHIYVSFTTLLVKLDMQGNVIGSVTGLLGHLGCLEFNDADGRLYGSLEYKNDAIGRDILRQEGAKSIENGFYVAIFDVEKIDRKGMSAERDGIMTTVLLKTVLDDYLGKVTTPQGTTVSHRYGCSGFDGISFGPSFDGKSRRNMLTIAYGIYGDNSRNDNDYQVLLQYDTSRWGRYETTLSQSNMHRNGPDKPNGRYFVYTGNTTWGVQNMEYDKTSNRWLLATYAGQKSHFANYTLFVIDGSKRATRTTLVGYDTYHRYGKTLHLAEGGDTDPLNPTIRGWHNEHGAYGICALGDNLFYIASGGKDERGNYGVLHLANFVGSTTEAFRIIK